MTFDNDDAVYLSIVQRMELLQRGKNVIRKNDRNIFKEGELEKESVWKKFHTPQLSITWTIIIVQMRLHNYKLM